MVIGKLIIDEFYLANKDALSAINENNKYSYKSLTGNIYLGNNSIGLKKFKSLFSSESITDISFSWFKNIKSDNSYFKDNFKEIALSITKYDIKDNLLIDVLIVFCENYEQNVLRLNEIIEIEKKEKERLEKLADQNKIKLFNENKTDVLYSLDKNKDGQVDLIENDFIKLLNKNQKKIISVDKNYIHQFVKVSHFIKTKKQNTQIIFESIRDTSNQEELEERVSLLKNQIHSYELLVFHSINMIGALVSEDLITFYEIYESFDKLSVFNSNWENEVSEKLANIGNKLDDLMYSIYNMEQNIVSELSHLSYVTQESFEDLNRSVTSQLKEVESSINTNNLLTGIQTYQMYKINKNTKGLRS